MLQLGGRVHAFQLGIFHDQIRNEGAMEGEVDVFVEGSGYEEPALLAVVRRQVGASSAEGNTQWVAGDDHGRLAG